MNDIPKIILCGSIAIDRVMSFKGKYRNLILQDKVNNISISVFLEKLQDSHGGVGGNIAYTLALLGENPILLASVGFDGKEYIEKLKKAGVETRFVHYSNQNTASFNVITDSDNCQIGGFFPGAMFDSDTLSLKKWKNKNVLVVISPHDPKSMLRQTEECRQFKLRFCYDIGQQVVNTPSSQLAKCVNGCEILILNEYELEIFCQKIKKTADDLKKLIPVVVTTLGEKGSIIEGKMLSGRKIRIPSVKPIRISDPTGAGDAYRGGFFFGYVRGWKLEQCGKVAAVTATYALENYGTQKHEFTLNQFIQRYETSYGEKILI